MRKTLISLVFMLLAVLACVRPQPEVVVVTATFVGPASTSISGIETTPVSQQMLSPVPDVPVTIPTPDPTRPGAEQSGGGQYVVQAGDTLSAIAAANNVSLEALMAANPQIDPNIISVGQVIQLPEQPTTQTSDFKILPDSRLVRGPESSGFDVAAFINQQPGYIRLATDTVDNVALTGTQIVQRVSLEFSVDARLLLALLEYKSAWLTNANPSEEVKTYPMGAQASPLGFDRNGLYRQLTWAADQLNSGYYRWKYGDLNTIEFEDGTRLTIAPGLNPATVGMQYFLSQYNTYAVWNQQISPDGFYRTYAAYFGDPFANAVDPLVPVGIQQPTLMLPFSSGETWFYTGGPHGGWGAGSAWAAVDFAPPDERPEGSSTCYVSGYWATAVAPGIIARTDEGVVVLDLDGDGNETTGWSILYLHMAAHGRVEALTLVEAGDRIGRPSCEGGFSNGTHMHIARRYNGEWIPADCGGCPAGSVKPPFSLGGWTVVGLPGQEYQGYLVNGGEQRMAEQGRLTPDNRVSW
jgi:LysM repeat protein